MDRYPPSLSRAIWMHGWMHECTIMGRNGDRQNRPDMPTKPRPATVGHPWKRTNVGSASPERSMDAPFRGSVASMNESTEERNSGGLWTLKHHLCEACEHEGTDDWTSTGQAPYVDWYRALQAPPVDGLIRKRAV
jgi:hypothetical protein